MTQASQAAKTDRDRQPKAKVEATVQPQQVEPGAIENLPDILTAAAGGDGLEGQAARLNDRRLLTAQRQALAGRIGQRHGNHHLQQVVAKAAQSERQRAGLTVQRLSPDAKAGATAPAQAPSKKLSEEEQKKKEEFLRRPITTSNFVPSSGSGKFDAKYFPASGQLFIIVNVYFDFKEELPAGEKNQAVLKSYKWTKAEQQEFTFQFIEHVTARWSGKFIFKCSKPGWEDVSAKPQIIVIPADNSGEAHYHASVTKVGEGLAGQDYRSGVKAKPHKHDSETEHNEDEPRTADLHSPDNTDKQDFRTQDILQGQSTRMFSALAGNEVTWIAFSKGRSEVPASKMGKLQKAAKDMPLLGPGAPPLPLLVIGSVTKGEPAEIAQKRAEAVKAVLAGAGVASPIIAQAKAGEDEAGVTIGVGELPAEWKNKYNVSEHEFGHMLGNPDEYPTGPDYDTKAWEELVKKAGARVPTMQDWTTSQMSGGSDILPAHYATIWDALSLMTTGDIEPSEWKIG